MHVTGTLLELFGDRELHVTDTKPIWPVLVTLLSDSTNFCVIGTDLELFIRIELQILFLSFLEWTDASEFWPQPARISSSASMRTRESKSWLILAARLRANVRLLIEHYCLFCVRSKNNKNTENFNGICIYKLEHIVQLAYSDG